MEIKLIENLSNDEYHNGKEYKDYWSSSNIKEYYSTPRIAHYRKYNNQESQSTPDMIFGTQMHDYLASKHCNGQPFTWNVFEPPRNNKGKYFGKTSQAYIDALNDIENGIHPDDYEKIKDIWNMILNCKDSWFFQKEILGQGIAESSIFIDNKLHKYKIRLDVSTDKYIFDYKTVKESDWSKEGLKSVIYQRKYDISGSMYQYFEHLRTGIWKPFIIIWIMKEPPYDILITDISEYCFENIGNGEVVANSGANVFLKLKDQHELCQLTNNWPGLANQFDAYNGIRIPKFSPRFERGYDQFEIETDNF